MTRGTRKAAVARARAGFAGALAHAGLRLAVALALLAVVASSCQGASEVDGENEPVEAAAPTTTPASPTPESIRPPASPTPGVAPSPSPVPTVEVEATEEVDPEREARLEELRASNQFLEFAEADRARHASWARFAYDHFAPHADGEVLFEWANKDELWNSIAPQVRDECLLAGPPPTRPLWDSDVLIPASVVPLWNDTTTEGRGQILEFRCSHRLGSGRLAETVTGVIVRTDEQLNGSVVGVSDVIVVEEVTYNTRNAATSEIRDGLWRWVFSEHGE